MRRLFLSWSVGLVIGCLSSSVMAKMVAQDVEGRWCSALDATETLGAYAGMPNPTLMQEVCVDFKIVRSNAQGGIGRYVLRKVTRKGLEYPMKRHPLERFDQAKQLYLTESPGLFAFYTTKDGQIVIKDQSLSRDLVTADGVIDEGGLMKFLVTYKPVKNQMAHASVAFVQMRKQAKRIDGRFDQRWQSLVQSLEDVHAQRR